jgi:hypothetical protein
MHFISRFLLLNVHNAHVTATSPESKRSSLLVVVVVAVNPLH